MGFAQEFKEFAMKGNVIDMAVGIVVGAAFNKIVTSLVNDVVMPPIGLLIAGVPFKDWKITLKEPVMLGEKTVTPGVYIGIGAFINTVIEFLIVALTVFIVVKMMTRLMHKRECKPAA